MKNPDDLLSISAKLEEYLKAVPEEDGQKIERAKALIVAILVYATDHSNNIYEAVGLLSDVKQEFNHLFDRIKLKTSINRNLN